jgi:predicted cobalt transporter CbtA
MKTNIPSNTIKPACRFKTSVLTAAVVAALAMALASPTEADDSNTATGIGALHSNTSGWNNTADGYQALYSNTEGNVNTAIGESALYSNTKGIGNTAIGSVALFYNTTGWDNTANGLGYAQRFVRQRAIGN